MKPDIGNEDLRAQIKTLQYEVDSLKHDRDVTSLRHGNELRDAQAKAEEVYQKARAEDGAKQVPLQKYDNLNRSLKDAQDAIINQKTALERKLRGAQEAERTAKEETEEAHNDLASMDRQHKHTLQEIESQLNKLTQTSNDLRNDLDSKSNSLKATQDRLSQREAEAGQLESEVLRLKAQTGDSETLGVIKRELSEQVAHIRQLEKTNREQAEELKVFRKKGKAVEVVEEEKRVLESKLGLLDNTQKQLREAQLQRQILEDERKDWAAYLENEGGDNLYETPQEVAKALVRQQLENASLVQQKGELQAEQMERDEMIKALESQRSSIQAELDSLKSLSSSSNTAADAITSPAVNTSSTIPPTNTTATNDTSRTKQRLEKQLSFAKREIALMRDQRRSFDTEEQTYHPESADSPFSAAKTARITDLESLVDESRREMASLTAEISALEDRINTSSGSSSSKQPVASASDNTIIKSPLKRTHTAMTAGEEGEDEDNKKTEIDESSQIGHLTRKLRTQQTELHTLTSTNAVLTAEQTALQKQLHQLRTSARTRVLSLRDNPTDNFESMKFSTIKILRQENKDLLATLQNQTQNQNMKTIPLSTLLSSQSHLHDLTLQLTEKDKRLLRLKQIFAAKTLEFREAVLSLLGWKMEFRADGKFVLSLNTSKSSGEQDDDDGEEEDESFIFDGEKGTMKVSGGSESAFALEVAPLFRKWVSSTTTTSGTGGGNGKSGGKGGGGGGGGGWIPGLMASVLLGKVEGGRG